MRQVVLDTETTGLETSQGHRIIEIGGVELVNRKLTGNHFHHYINPERSIDQGALQVHGITEEFLQDKPTFHHIADEFIEFARGSELVIHNAPFDIGFLDYELSLLADNRGKLTDYCRVLDTLAMARQMHPGQRNSLDALCRRYEVDNSNRQLHGALLDAEILAEVYLAMTGGQVGLQLGSGRNQEDSDGENFEAIRRLEKGRPALRVIGASEDELLAHEQRLTEIDKISGTSVWRKLVE